MHIKEPYLDFGRSLVSDNWNTSVGLAEEMNKRQTHLVGTLNKKRSDNPKEVVHRQLKKGETFAQQNDSNVVLKWRAQKKRKTNDLLLLSTRHDDKMIEVKKRSTGTEFKPEIVTLYNKGKSYINRADQMAAYFNSLRKSTKWYKKIAFDILLGTAVVNTYSLYKDVTENKMNITEFREELIEALFNLKPEVIVGVPAQVVHHVEKDSKRKRC